MIIVGIDVAKNKHNAIIIDSKGDTLTKSFIINNSHKGAETLINKIKSINTNNLPVVIGMEATGYYLLPLYSRFVQEGFEINVINPIQSDSFRNMYIRQSKNNSINAFIIAEVIRFSRFTTTSLAEEDMLAFRNLSRFRLYYC